VVIILTLVHYTKVIEEVKLMLSEFGESYAKYMGEVPDRFIPRRKLLRKLRPRH